MASLNQFPDEIILQILHYVPPDDILVSLQLSSRRLHRLANEPILWRQACAHSFDFWHPYHRFSKNVCRPLLETSWKTLFIIRRRRNIRAAALFEGILATKYGRVEKFEELCLLGYDAKDFLLSQARTPDAAQDVLARRYFSKAALASIRRGVAIQIWDDLRNSEAAEARSSQHAPQVVPRRLERALSAFDMFVIQDDLGDVDGLRQLYHQRKSFNPGQMG
ncbi:hypothetical protein CTRI78_v011955 [Colletotrichum trifolii]|uniref:F-box domain-containing protein n=1 Tax=Colletotrichum trifolii TaxID=5466 RepID=A0A4R8Q6P0_COLTR|nr:hypothetical protein CTRI78_v011955 [Colletotrichum trifolii]